MDWIGVGADAPGLRNNDVVEGLMLVAEACQANPKNHFVETVKALLGDMGRGLSSTLKVQNALRKSSRIGGLVVPPSPDTD